MHLLQAVLTAASKSVYIGGPHPRSYDVGHMNTPEIKERSERQSAMPPVATFRADRRTSPPR